jgi:hypothetical protein
LFNVSTDYLLGRAECTTPEYEEINKITGLTEKSLLKLKKMNASKDEKSYEGEIIPGLDGLPAINALLEDDSDILSLLNKYLYATYETGFAIREFKYGSDYPPNTTRSVAKLFIDVPIKSGKVYKTDYRELDPDDLRYSFLKRIEERLSNMMNQIKKNVEEENNNGKCDCE